MIINVNKTYRINSDAYQYVVQKKGNINKETGERNWRNLGYYVDLQKAIVGLTEYRIRTIDSSCTDEIVKAVKKIEKESMKIIKELQGIPLKSQPKQQREA
ncbi:MAG: hypothetical protein GF388_01800 [Candidatus Aegiribacteria sp.]|nr:hypothetical protein [Candidatus Aegiribacteria sp.]